MANGKSVQKNITLDFIQYKQKDKYFNDQFLGFWWLLCDNICPINNNFFNRVFAYLADE